MTMLVKREAIYEDGMTDQELDVWETTWLNLRQEWRLISRCTDAGYARLTAAEHLIPFASKRLRLVKHARAYRGFSDRVVKRSQPSEVNANPDGLNLLTWLARGAKMLVVGESRLALKVSVCRTRWVLAKIERDTELINKLLDDLNVAADSNLRPGIAVEKIAVDPAKITSQTTTSNVTKKSGKSMAKPAPFDPNSPPRRIRCHGKIYDWHKISPEWERVRLTDPQKVAVYLRYCYRMGDAAVAEYLGIKPKSAYDRIRGAERLLEKSVTNQK